MESTASIHRSLACVSLVPFQRGEINLGFFFVVKIVKSHRFPLFLLVKPQPNCADSSTSAMYVKAKHPERETGASETQYNEICYRALKGQDSREYGTAAPYSVGCFAHIGSCPVELGLRTGYMGTSCCVLLLQLSLLHNFSW